MSFGLLNALMLLGLAGLAIPPIIHLLNRRRFDVVDWGAMQFLQISETTRRRLLIEELLLGLAVLDRAQHAGLGPHRGDRLELVEQRPRHVLGVERDHVDLLREPLGRNRVVERTDHHAVGDLRGRALCARVEHQHAIPHAPRRERHHAPELAATEDAERTAGEDQSSLSPSTRWVWAAR